jgi:hypothetical protein
LCAKRHNAEVLEDGGNVVGITLRRPTVDILSDDAAGREMCQHLPDVDAPGAKCFGEARFAELEARVQPLLAYGFEHALDDRIVIHSARPANRIHRITLTRRPLDLEAKTLPAFCSACPYDCQHRPPIIGAKSSDCTKNVKATRA